MKRTPLSWISRTNIFKIAILSKLFCKFNGITIKISKMFFTWLEKESQKTYGMRTNRGTKAILNRKRNAGDITILHFKLYYKTILKILRNNCLVETQTCSH